MDDSEAGGTVGRKKGKKAKRNVAKRQTDDAPKEELVAPNEGAPLDEIPISAPRGNEIETVVPLKSPNSDHQEEENPEIQQPSQERDKGSSHEQEHDSLSRQQNLENGHVDTSAYESTIASLEAQLAQAHEENAQLDDKYKGLLGRVASIRTTLTDRLKQDAEELQQTKGMVEELEDQNRTLLAEKEALEASLKQTLSEKKVLSQEIQDLRHRFSISQQNWSKEREEADIIRSELLEELESTRKSVQDWEVLAMEESSVRRALEERCSDLEEQFSSQKDALEQETLRRSQQTSRVSDLQSALDDIQKTRKEELRNLVETTQSQIETLTLEKSQLQERMSVAEAQAARLSDEIQRISHFESEVKEKTLLIGKLRHQGVILNEHLTKALRMIKRDGSKDNVDRQLVTNLFLSFLGLPRGDAKRFEVLQLIANYLKWTDEDRETAGLSRPGTSGTISTGSIPSRSMPSPLLLQSHIIDSQDGNSGGENLAELWASFLQQQTEKKTEE